jgi:hypothetical protein
LDVNDAAHDDLGVVDFLVVELTGEWSGAGFGILVDLVNRDVIRILDVEVMVRDDDGVMRLCEPGAGPAAVLSGLSIFAGVSSGLLDADDAQELAEHVGPGRTGLVVIYENLWTAALGAQLRREGARVVAHGQIGADDIAAVVGDPP